MERWRETYKKELNSLSKSLDKKKGVIVGFNVNVDKIIEVTPEKLSSLITGKEIIVEEEASEPKFINSPSDLIKHLLSSMKKGIAEEILIHSEEVVSWIEETFTISKIKLGGQAGIIANLLKTIGMKRVLLSLPTYNSALSELINPEILTIVKKDENYIIQNIKNHELIEQNQITHYIFEYKAGEYKLNNYTLECKRANRFIVSFDVVNSHLKYSEGLLKNSSQFIQEYSLAILSGFHLIDMSYSDSFSYIDAIDSVVSMIKLWKKHNSEIFIHLEIASTQDPNLRKMILKSFFPLVDSIGVNEQELLSFAEVIDSETATELRENMILSKVFKAMKIIHNNYPELRIHLHNLGYYLILSRPLEPNEIERRKRSLIYSSFFAAVKAKRGKIDSFEDILNVSINLSSPGYDELASIHSDIDSSFTVSGDLATNGVLNESTFTLVGIPTIVIEDSVELVGLGDTISSISVLFDS